MVKSFIKPNQMIAICRMIQLRVGHELTVNEPYNNNFPIKTKITRAMYVFCIATLVSACPVRDISFQPYRVQHSEHSASYRPLFPSGGKLIPSLSVSNLIISISSNTCTYSLSFIFVDKLLQD